MPWLLLAMQAAGMVVDWLGTHEQQRMMDLGAKVQQAGIEANLSQTRLESADASLQAMKKLNQTTATQAAIFAARGTMPGAGSALALTEETFGNFFSDQRTRRINLLGRENEIKAGGSIAKLNQATSNAKLWTEFRTRTINRIPTSPSAWGQMGKSFGLTQMGGT